MKDSALLVNTGRGPIVAEDDLAQALERRLFAKAGLDVYHQDEPTINPRLLKLGNVVLAPIWTRGVGRLELAAAQA